MAKFKYTGKAHGGGPVSGEIEAESLAQANAMLKQRQILPSTIEAKKGLGEIEINLPGMGPTVTTKDIVIFTRQFATMIDAGLPLVQCLDILASQNDNPLMKKILFEVKGSVEGGSTFADALAKHPKTFDQLFVNLVAAGEVGGILDTILNRLSSFMEKGEKLKGKVKGAMMYPMIVISIATVIVGGLLIFVVPIFEEMFAGFGAALPAPTQIVVNLSDFLQNYYWALALGLFGSVQAFKRTYATKKGRRFFDGIFLKMPVFGDILKKSAVARFTRTLGTMLSSGVPILEALDIVAKTAGNLVIEESIMKCKDSLSEGKTLSEPLGKSGIFPGMVVQMVAVGESTGAMDTMLNKIADFYEDEVESAVDGLTSMIEPLLMAFLGIVVGGLVMALYLPIFGLAGAAGG